MQATVLICGVVLALVIISLIFIESATSYSKEILARRRARRESSMRRLHSRGGFNLEAFLAGRMPDEHTGVQQRPHSKEGRASDVLKVLRLYSHSRTFRYHESGVGTLSIMFLGLLVVTW